MRYGDRRLVKRGTQGTALQVSVAGKDPYPTTLYICAHLRSGDTVPVYVSPHNAKRVTVDLTQLAAARDAELQSIGTHHHGSRRVMVPESEPRQTPAPTVDVADELAKLADSKTAAC